MQTRNDFIIHDYKEAVLAKKESQHIVVDYNWCNRVVQLDCWMIVEEDAPQGFVKTGEDSYQYAVPLLGGGRQRPKAYRIPFLNDPNYDKAGMTVSHLCHNKWCYNWEHHVLEPLAVNKGRNGCPGGDHCHHIVKCLVPGPYSMS